MKDNPDIAQLKRLGELTNTPWKTLVDNIRLYERVVKPNLAAYLAGTSQLIEDCYGAESREWYYKYRELYILSWTLQIHPKGTPPEPLSYDSIDDHVLTQALFLKDNIMDHPI